MGSKACPWLLLVAVALLLAVAGSTPVAAEAEAAFDKNYEVQWGDDGYHLVIRGTEVNITMDQSSGAGFRSKSMYGSGFFHMRMKLPSGYTAGVVTTFYLISQPEDGSRDEVDFEFLGDKAGVPITLQTNVFVNGRGDREQRLHLWFDPAADFHDYKILWNPYQLDVRGRHADPGAEEPDGHRAGVPVPGEADDAGPGEHVGRLRLGDGRRPDKGGLVQGALHGRVPGVRRQRLRQRQRDAVRVAGTLVERRRVPEHHGGAAGGVRGGEEALHELRLLR
ncbi:unnamed protein product [Urochloa decumbens]|uniref:GH16 domain-containing protein n=1 Tax=Urochloa decumbens TaxID=240449 RepID=A0ABC9DRY2_9POAL